MYLRHFGLSAPPFRITPDTRCFFAGAGRGAVLDALEYAVTSGEGIVKLVGEVGSGKTMLCRMLAERLPDEVELVYLADPALGPEEILRAIALELGLPAAGNGRLDCMHALQHALIERHADGRRVVVFIEEAQAMPAETLEAMRLLSNLETRTEKLLQIVLFGQPELDRLLAADGLRQLRDRIVHHLELRPLDARDTRDYLEHRLRAAGLTGALPFTPAAIRLLARRSRGLLRRIHVLADRALLAAYAGGSQRVGWREMRRALNDDRGTARTLATPARLTSAALAASVAALATAWLTAPRPAEAPPAAEIAFLGSQIPGTDQQSPALAGSGHGNPGGAGSGNDFSSFEQLVAHTTEWLSRTDTGPWAIQLMVSDGPDPDRLERFLLRQDLRAHRARLRAYPARIGGQLRWSVLYGDFPDLASARAALGRLPASLRRFGPYVRSLKAVRKEAVTDLYLAKRDRE